MKRITRPEPVITTGRIVKQTVSFRGKSYNLNLHMLDYTYPEFSFEMIDKVTNDEGVELIGVWHWGTYGATHLESLEFETRKSQPDYLTMRTSGSWCNGRKKNGRKTLLDIVEKTS
jgi:hypothetical protein